MKITPICAQAYKTVFLVRAGPQHELSTQSTKGGGDTGPTAAVPAISGISKISTLFNINVALSLV